MLTTSFMRAARANAWCADDDPWPFVELTLVWCCCLCSQKRPEAVGWIAASTCTRCQHLNSRLSKMNGSHGTTRFAWGLGPSMFFDDETTQLDDESELRVTASLCLDDPRGIWTENNRKTTSCCTRARASCAKTQIIKCCLADPYRSTRLAQCVYFRSRPTAERDPVLVSETTRKM